MKYDKIRTLQSINARKSRSAWERGVNEYAYELAERLCTPSELKKKKYGELPPYRGMSWLNLQARALRAASYVVKSHLKIKKHENGIYSRDLEPHQK
jgi:hypothetical protein